jgi:hypothetical protein
LRFAPSRAEDQGAEPGPVADGERASTTIEAVYPPLVRDFRLDYQVTSTLDLPAADRPAEPGAAGPVGSRVVRCPWRRSPGPVVEVSAIDAGLEVWSLSAAPALFRTAASIDVVATMGRATHAVRLDAARTDVELAFEADVGGPPGRVLATATANDGSGRALVLFDGALDMPSRRLRFPGHLLDVLDPDVFELELSDAAAAVGTVLVHTEAGESHVLEAGSSHRLVLVRSSRFERPELRVRLEVILRDGPSRTTNWCVLSSRRVVIAEADLPV